MGCGHTASSYSQIVSYTWRAGGQEGHDDDSTSGLNSVRRANGFSVDQLQTSLGLTAGLNPMDLRLSTRKEGLAHLKFVSAPA